MCPSTYDPCLLARTNDGTGIVAVQVDDTLIAVDETFLPAEAQELKNADFAAKALQRLTAENTPLCFNGLNVNYLRDGAISIT